ncbi:B12-binding domain-containing radical SAM protein [Sediminispirochaeta smaragdinae]|uniref:Radical SAM domain protein n=1 Tax=Sediminispirochaeta smaragdinae (strain DSM 11293 / JCM 15392 / SEBR 4228) TaxID=573413 RepID=E1R8L0_SEDSS|nr:B12-binding domain-containing radical SAM protein [Sediminispirochaeta smaragdinae]ADK81767.1 Radical SAM domain protein [Sediminispirochaeta smaragdinae DSM 11293]
MRIALIQPPLRDFYRTPHRLNALGLELVGQILRDAGCEVSLYNFPRHKQVRSLVLPKALSHLRPFLVPGERGALSGFGSFRRFGPDYDEAARLVGEGRPDLVFIGLFAWAYGEDALSMASSFRKLYPALRLGIGGAGVSVDPSRFERCGFFDLIFTGLGELSLRRWLAAGAPLSGRFDAPADACEGEKEALPAVSYHEKGGILSISASRGCPMRCRFCANRLVHGLRFRTASVSRIMAVAEKAVVDRHVRLIAFEDDNLSADRGWFLELLSALHRRFPEAWCSAENGIDYRFLDPDDLRIIFKLGFRKFNFSIASVESGERKRERRSGSLEHYARLVSAASGLGAEIVTYFIAGLPGESFDIAVKNLLYLEALPTVIGISLFYPVPGIEGFDASQIADAPFQKALGSAAWPWGGGYSTAQLLTAFRLSRLTNALMHPENDPYTSALIREVVLRRRLLTLQGRHHQLTDLPWQDRSMVLSFLEKSSRVHSFSR